MPARVFYRALFSGVVFEIRSNESLGVITHDQPLEDYDGYPGALTLYHLGSGVPYQILMADIDNGGPPHDYFRGQMPLDELPNGHYEVRGRVTDVAGNETILSAYGDPDGSESIEPLAFEILPGFGIQVDLGLISISGGYVLTLPVPAFRLDFSSWTGRITVDLASPHPATITFDPWRTSL